MDLVLFIIVSYAVIAAMHLICSYKKCKEECSYSQKPVLSYFLIRTAFFPITAIRIIFRNINDCTR